MISKTMPPPIEVTCSKGSALTVTVTPAWRDLGKKKTGYFKQVPLPLPHDAATQNLVLSLLTCVSEEFDCDGEIMRRTSPRNKKALCRKIGLTHSTSYRAFNRACLEADTWLKKHGGELDFWWTTRDKNVLFVIKNPKVKRSKAQAKKQEEKASEETKRLMERIRQPLTKNEYKKARALVCRRIPRFKLPNHGNALELGEEQSCGQTDAQPER